MSKREFEELVAAGEDVHSMLQKDSSSMELLNEYKDTWLSKGEIEKLDNEWKGDDVRMLPPEVVETMVGKVFESTPGGGWQAGWGLLSVGWPGGDDLLPPDGLHRGERRRQLDAAGADPSLPHAPRYQRVLQGAVVAAADGSAHLPGHRHPHRGLHGRGGDPRLLRQGPGEDGGAERAATTGAGAWASFLGDVGDQPFRVASWTGHARKYGFNTPEQWRELARLDRP